MFWKDRQLNNIYWFVAFYEVDVSKPNGEVQIYKDSEEKVSFIHVTEIENGASTAPWSIRYFDFNSREITRESLLAVLDEDLSGNSSGVGTAEPGMVYVLEFIIFGLGMILIRYYLKR